MKIDKVKEIFAANPKAKKVFITSDDMPFLKENAAINHQSSLNRESKKAEEITVFSTKVIETIDNAKAKKDADAKAKKDADAKAKKDTDK